MEISLDGYLLLKKSAKSYSLTLSSFWKAVSEKLGFDVEEKYNIFTSARRAYPEFTSYTESHSSHLVGDFMTNGTHQVLVFEYIKNGADYGSFPDIYARYDRYAMKIVFNFNKVAVVEDKYIGVYSA